MVFSIQLTNKSGPQELPTISPACWSGDCSVPWPSSHAESQKLLSQTTVLSDKPQPTEYPTVKIQLTMLQKHHPSDRCSQYVTFLFHVLMVFLCVREWLRTDLSWSITLVLITGNMNREPRQRGRSSSQERNSFLTNGSADTPVVSKVYQNKQTQISPGTRILRGKWAQLVPQQTGEGLPDLKRATFSLLCPQLP